MLLALSFVPPDDVAECFDELNDNHPAELAPVYDYCEDNYIGRLRSRRRRAAPTFPIPSWNMRSRVTDGQPRTNNSVEGWHHAFQFQLRANIRISTNLSNTFKPYHIQNSKLPDSTLAVKDLSAVRTSTFKSESHDVLQLCCLRTVTDHLCSTSCTQHRTLVSGGRVPFILSGDISEQFNDVIVYVCVATCWTAFRAPRCCRRAFNLRVFVYESSHHGAVFPYETKLRHWRQSSIPA